MCSSLHFDFENGLEVIVMDQSKVILVMLIILFIIAGIVLVRSCDSDSSDNDYDYSYSGSSSSGSYDDYDYDKGYGYDAPKKGQSFSDYVKEQDPDLYNSMKDIYDNLQ